MKYADRDEFVKSLRDFADFIEEKGVELPLTKYDMQVTVSHWVYDDEDNSARKQLREVIKVLGACEKKWQSSYLSVEKKIGWCKLKFETARENVCERVVTGKEEVAEQIIPAYERELVEWVCDDPALLADGQKFVMKD